eukprot:COSAG02_NODE_340_length_24179_cov_6.401644_4_plen_142_part_00
MHQQEHVYKHTQADCARADDAHYSCIHCFELFRKLISRSPHSCLQRTATPQLYVVRRRCFADRARSRLAGQSVPKCPRPSGSTGGALRVHGTSRHDPPDQGSSGPPSARQHGAAGRACRSQGSAPVRCFLRSWQTQLFLSF